MPTKSQPTVAAYFAARLGRSLIDPQSRTATAKRHPASPFHPNFHIGTGCGVDCKATIDAAEAFVVHVREAFGDATDEESKIVEIAEAVVLCLVHG